MTSILDDPTTQNKVFSFQNGGQMGSRQAQPKVHGYVELTWLRGWHEPVSEDHEILCCLRG